MAFSNGAKSIVQDGLVLSTDAGNIVCFTSGSSNTYSGIGSPGSGSLDNYPTYNANEGGGSWFCDGTDPYIVWEKTLEDIIGTSAIQDITIECWVKWDSSPASYQCIWGQSVGSNITGWNCYVWSDGRMFADCNFGSGPTRKYPVVTVSSVQNWAHFVWTYNGSHSTIYGNGVQGQSLAVTGNLSTSNTQPWIGGGQHGDLDGWITCFNICVQGVNVLICVFSNQYLGNPSSKFCFVYGFHMVSLAPRM